MNGSDAIEVLYGAGAGLFILVMNSPSILSITDGYVLLHLFIIALALYMLLISPFALLRTKLIQTRDCSRLLRAEAIGISIGSIAIFPVIVISGFSGVLSHTVQLVITGSLNLFFITYDLTFSNMFSHIAENGTLGEPRWGPDLVSTNGFSRMLLVANIYPILPILALLASSQFLLVLAIIIFQAVSSMAGLGLHGLSIKWTKGTVSPQGQPAIAPC